MYFSDHARLRRSGCPDLSRHRASFAAHSLLNNLPRAEAEPCSGVLRRRFAPAAATVDGIGGATSEGCGAMDWYLLDAPLRVLGPPASHRLTGFLLQDERPTTYVHHVS